MWKVKNTTIKLEQGDITDCEVDAIVNAANTDLILGAGVAGAIRRKGGPSIQSECNKYGPIPLGGAAITTGGNLKSKYVIHAASMHLGGSTTEDSLRKSIINSLKLAVDNEIETIAFPAIGTGIAGFPIEKCAEIMYKTFQDFLRKEEHKIKQIILVLYSKDDYDRFKQSFKSSNTQVPVS
ncbi:MAG: macro domain-containing protein [Candidatus Heimdallarchaeaceae archaeon]